MSEIVQDGLMEGPGLPFSNHFAPPFLGSCTSPFSPGDKETISYLQTVCLSPAAHFPPLSSRGVYCSMLSYTTHSILMAWISSPGSKIIYFVFGQISIFSDVNLMDLTSLHRHPSKTYLPTLFLEFSKTKRLNLPTLWKTNIKKWFYQWQDH